SLVNQNISKAGSKTEPSVGILVRIPPHGHLLTIGSSVRKIKYTTLHRSPADQATINQGQTIIRNIAVRAERIVGCVFRMSNRG
ncbi:MAG TPA: hypothetical protein VHX39_12210, partial [Acetobacteraceae bacterium]|nr:hypothetical protein [Acetobacteraceae bacterium]